MCDVIPTTTKPQKIWKKKSISTIYAVMILNALRIQMHGLIRMIRQKEEKKEKKKNTHTHNRTKCNLLVSFFTFFLSVSLSMYICIIKTQYVH